MNRLSLALALFASAGVAAAAPETRPAPPPSEVDELRAEVKALREQVAALRGEIEQVKAAGGPWAGLTRPTTGKNDPGAAAGSGVKPASTFADRARAAEGYSDDAARANLAEAERLDAAIRSWLATHPVPEPVAKAMWEGRPAIGMTADALNAFGHLTILSETTSGQTAQFVVPDFKPHKPEDRPVYYLQLNDGKVEIITRP